MPSFPTMDSIACALGVSIDFLKGNCRHNTEYPYIKSLMEVNGLSQENKDDILGYIGKVAYKEYQNSGKKSRPINELWQELDL